MGFFVAFAYIVLGAVAGGFGAWRHVKNQVAKAELKIRNHVLVSDYDETEKEAIIGYLEESLNKMK